MESIVDMGMQKSGVGQQIQTVGEARLPEDLEAVAARYKPGESLAFTVEVDVSAARAGGSTRVPRQRMRTDGAPLKQWPIAAL